MAEADKYDEAAATRESIAEIPQKWLQLRAAASSGRKAWFTQMKTHYARIILADPDAAAELLAMYEDLSNYIRKQAGATTA